MKLTAAQLVILSQAARREDRAVVLPEKLRGGAAQKVVNRLLAHGLLMECAPVGEMPIWRRAEDGTPLALVITDAGLAAIGIGERANQEQKTGSSQRHKTKQEIVLDLLRRAEGASISELVAATGWQPHSVRGFLSGAVGKKLQMPLVSQKGENGVRRYHIAVLAQSAA